MFPAAAPPPTVDDAAPAAAVELEPPDNSSVGKELPTSVGAKRKFPLVIRSFRVCQSYRISAALSFVGKRESAVSVRVERSRDYLPTLRRFQFTIAACLITPTTLIGTNLR